jgi:hypothetical protein
VRHRRQRRRSNPPDVRGGRRLPDRCRLATLIATLDVTSAGIYRPTAVLANDDVFVILEECRTRFGEHSTELASKRFILLQRQEPAPHLNTGEAACVNASLREVIRRVLHEW